MRRDYSKQRVRQLLPGEREAIFVLCATVDGNDIYKHDGAIAAC